MRNITWGIALLILGLLLLLDNLGIADFGDMVGKFWPLIIIAVGIMILTRRGRHGGTPSSPAGPLPSINGDIVDESFVFENLYRKITSSSFKGGSISTIFGNAFIDLSGTTPAEGEYILRHHSVFGDSTILLAPQAPVAVQASTIAGHFRILGQQRGGFGSDMRVVSPTYAGSANRLTLVITKVFGNVIVEQAS
ncbi:MAG TPA: LiaF domain-containing protein [Bacteroidota bacterium]|nr:LiaF domain-containing protein [Bacteroidota bacterium]